MSPGSSHSRCQTWPWHWGEGAHLSAGSFCLNKPRSWAAHTNNPPLLFFLKFISSLLSLFSLLWFYFWGSTLPAATIRPPGLLGWHLAITSPAPGDLLDLLAMASHHAEGLAALSALPSLAAAVRRDRLSRSSLGLRGCKVLPGLICGQNHERWSSI